jgi:hypothetical protein
VGSSLERIQPILIREDNVNNLKNDQNYVLSLLQGSTEYSWTIQAGNGWSETTSFHFWTKPVRPASLEVKAVGETEMTLGWEEDR